MNPISSASAANGAGSDSVRLADVLRPRRHGQLALGEAQPQRRVALREQADAADDVEQLLAGQLELVLELLGQELAVVRELPVDPARRQPGAVGAEDDVVLLQRRARSCRAGPAIRASSWSARAGMIASSSGSGSGAAVSLTASR